MFAYECLLVDVSAGIATITLNRPKELNALNPKLYSELDDIFQKLKDDSSIRAVIITGNEKAFAAGADITSMLDMSAVEAKDFAMNGQKTVCSIENFAFPVIAACDGFTLGGGCELAMACDIRIASDKAKFGQPEINLGIIPGCAGTQRLPRLVGKGQAKLLILTGDMIDAQEALRIGLVDKVVPQEELMATAKKLASRIGSKAQYALRQAKRAINQGIEIDSVTGAAFEAECFGMCFSTSDRKEGMLAYVEKRKPVFTGN